MKHCIHEVLFPDDLPEYLSGVELDKLDNLIEELGRRLTDIPDDQGEWLQPWFNMYEEFLTTPESEVGPPNYTALEFKMACIELIERLDECPVSEISDQHVGKALIVLREIVQMLPYACGNQTFDNPSGATCGGEDEQNSDQETEDSAA
jgi:hypothetical protein